MNTEEMIRDFRRLTSVIGEEFIEAIIAAEDSAEMTDRARSIFTSAIWLANSEDLQQTMSERGLTENVVYERLSAAHNDIGYIYTLLLGSGRLEALAEYKPFEWPYPYSALGALVAQPDNMSPKHEPGEYYSLQGFTTFAWLGKTNREQVREFVTKMCDEDSSISKILEIAIR